MSPHLMSDPLDGKTKGQIEAAITTVLSQFERDFLGRGPQEARTYVIDDVILVKMSGILSPAEQQLSHETGGVDLIKTMRTRLIESSSDALKGLVEQEVGLDVVSLHTDISSRTGERVFVFTLADDLESRFA